MLANDCHESAIEIYVTKCLTTQVFDISWSFSISGVCIDMQDCIR